MHYDFQYILHTSFSSSIFSVFLLLSSNVSFPFHPTALLFILFLLSKDFGPYYVLTFSNPCFPIVFSFPLSNIIPKVTAVSIYRIFNLRHFEYACKSRQVTPAHDVRKCQATSHTESPYNAAKHRTVAGLLALTSSVAI